MSNEDIQYVQDTGGICNQLPHNGTSDDSNSRLKRKLDDTVEELKEMKRKFKASNEKVRRMKKKVDSLDKVVEQLLEKEVISQSYATILESSYSDVPHEMLKKALGSTTTKMARFPDSLKAFALTLQFYSTKAYNYVRSTFNLALPHPRTLRRWYQSIDGQPGFTQEAFTALKAKSVEGDVVCSLMVDEMAIRKHLTWDNERERFCGFRDIGTGVDDDSAPLATEALVFMAVSLKDHWKVPLGYFLIDGMTSTERANLVKTCLLKLHDVGVRAVSLTSDGPSSNQAMFKILGASLDPDKRKPFFTHPASGHKVFCILDACHMLKLVRNTLATQCILVDGEGGEVKWNFIDNLHKLQQAEGLHLGNKLRKAHIEWGKQKMKVNLAAQTLSASVADAIEFADQVLKLPEFTNSAPTVKFIRIFDRLFDILNSRNPFGKGYKSPLRQENKQVIGNLNLKCSTLIQCT